MPRFLPIGKEAKGAAGFLLAALPALGALLTALAISGDLIGRMARNHPLASFGAFGSAAVAVFLGAIAAYGLQEGSREERGVLSLGIIVLGAALVFGVYAGVGTWGDRAQPSITVTPKSGSLVAVSVHGIGLRSSDHIVVEVEQLLRGSDRQGQPTWQPGQPLYGASLGPQRPARWMTLRVLGIAAGQPRRNLAEWSLAPNAGGEFDRSLAVVVGRAYTDVCVVASVSTREPECPASVEDGTVWTQLAVPPAQ